MQARDVMVSPVITVERIATVRDVAKVLLEKRISAVPVVDNVGRVVGIVTESDLMHRAEAGLNAPTLGGYISSPVTPRSRLITSNRMPQKSKML